MRLFRNFTLRFPITISIICLIFVITEGQIYAVYADEATEPAAQLYLPLVQRSTPTATATPIVTPPAAQLEIFLDPSWKTSNATVAVDANSGQHVAFYYYEATFEPRPTHAVYAYCPSQCDQPAAWRSVSFAQRVREVQLELTPSGKPRLLIVADSTVYTGGSDYYYAACDGDCTQQGVWSLTKIASGHVPGTALQNNDELPQRSFELDAAGRPRFVYYDENQLVQPNHFGLFYLFCNSGCDQAAQWRETLITTVNWTPRFGMERVYHPALAFTPDGKPRLVSAQFFPIGDGDPTLTYFECNDACDNTTSWQKVSLALRGGGAEPSADIEVDLAGRPRIAFYQEALLNDQGKRLFYFWCNDNCLAVASWQLVDLGLGSFNGQEPDLELDRQGRPRIAYADWNAGGVGFAWCNEHCDTTAAKWDHQLLEDRAKLRNAWPVAYPPHCDGGLWNGVTPTLVLAANGYPQIAYDATYHAHCLYDDNPNDNIPPVSQMHLIRRAARLISFPQPFTLPSDPVTPPPDTPTPVTPTPVTPAPVTPAPVTPTETPVPTPVRVALTQTLAHFADQQWQTSSASVAVDNHGGKHIAFVYDDERAGAPSSAVYHYCASACDNRDNWQGVAFAERVNEVQLELDPAGIPHLLIRTNSTADPEGYDYLYAVCSGNCTMVGGWSLLPLLTTHGGAAYEQHDTQQPQRSFELDPSGRPRFVYFDDTRTVDPLHVGIFYAWCDENCTEISQWQEVMITAIEVWNGKIENQEHARYLALAFTPDGKPRLVTAEYYPFLTTDATTWSLAYFACDEMCDLGYLWSKVKLYASGEGPLPSADLAIDTNGHPHVAFYQEKTSAVLPDGSQTPAVQNLFYLHCQVTNCLTHWNWDSVHLGIDGLDGGAPDLELDTQDRPRMAYALGDTGGLGYSWCNADCLAGSAQWQHGLVEGQAQLQAAWPQTQPTNCTTGGWTGWTPTLMLPPNGLPVVAYDAIYVAHCFANGAWQDEELMRTGRLVVFTQP